MVHIPEQTPYATNQELWYWTGGLFSNVPLQSAVGAWNISTMGGSRFGIPTLRGANVTVPYRAGQSQIAKFPDQRTVTLTMWSEGLGDSVAATYPATDQRLAFNSNIQQLRAMFFTRNQAGSVQGQLKRNWYVYVSGTGTLVTSTAMAEIAGSMDLTMNGRTSAAFSVDLLLNDPYFYGALQTVACTGGSTSITGKGEGLVGEGWPSNVNAFTVSMTANGTVSNNSLGVSFTLTGATSFPVVVDVLNQTVIDNSSHNIIGNFSHAGSRLWMALIPGTNSISVSAGTATFRFNDSYI